MTLRRRLFLLVTLIIVVGISTAAALFAYLSWRSVLERTERDERLVAQLLSQSIGLIQQVPEVIQEIVGSDVQAQADIVAHLTRIARQRKASATEINRALRGIAAENSIPEIWVTDASGKPIFWSIDDVNARISADFGVMQHPIFRPLLEGRKFSIFTALQHREPGSHEANLQHHEPDSHDFYYGGVTLPDRDGMVLIARRPERIDRIIGRIGLKRLMETVMAAATIDTIWVFDETLKPVAVSATPDRDHATELSAEVRALIEQVVGHSTPASYLQNGGIHQVLLGQARLYVAAPIFNTDGLPDGAALMSLPVNMQTEFNSLLLVGGGLTVLLLLASMILALPFLDRIVGPLARLTVQTRRLVKHDFRADAEMREELLDVSRNRADEVGCLGNALSSMVFQLETHISELKETTAAKERIEGELSAARNIQMGMLPQVFALPGHAECDLYAVLEPAKAVGGDLFDFFLLDTHRLFVLVGDVSDKGVPAALFMAVTKTLFAVEARRDASSISGIVARVNAALCENNPESMFVTVLAGILDLCSGEFVFCDGGHERPWVLRREGPPEQVAKQGGVALGFLADAVYREEKPIHLADGDGLLLYTDGVSEAMNANNAAFTVARLGEALAALDQQASARETVEQLMAEIESFVSAYPQSDDITLMALRWRHPAHPHNL
ncbi:MAG: PP2C family protein-serine/threonine phosphatase [Phycisphaerales bacterium]|nr:PP2C family protein-serine/threonine phosphatase [Phycisphaerales bacterium]